MSYDVYEAYLLDMESDLIDEDDLILEELELRREQEQLASDRYNMQQEQEALDRWRGID